MPRTCEVIVQWWHCVLWVGMTKGELKTLLEEKCQCEVLEVLKCKRAQDMRETATASVRVRTSRPLCKSSKLELNQRYPVGPCGGIAGLRDDSYSVEVTCRRKEVHDAASPLSRTVLHFLAAAPRRGALAHVGRMTAAGVAALCEASVPGSADGIDMVAASSATDGVVCGRRIHPGNHVSVFMVACKTEEAAAALRKCDDVCVWVDGSRFTLEVTSAQAGVELFNVAPRCYGGKAELQEMERRKFDDARVVGRTAGADLRECADSAAVYDMFEEGPEPVPQPPRFCVFDPDVDVYPY
eukprot:TRINITY_DN2626_c0_g3_i1.p1 TRINITY_DN2626_c0_g3~~TRINITY_DN2626_c0_g3_i1.p1  ORF type:complete len:297 (+),score=110.70 TRINITY_DN2626_c0_g3_i1:82-972(+)